MNDGQRVRRLSTGYTGTVHGAVLDDHAYVRWDAGGGHAVHVTDLEETSTP